MAKRQIYDLRLLVSFEPREWFWVNICCHVGIVTPDR